MIELALTASLPAGNPATSNAAPPSWAVQLSNKDRCVLSTGANASLDGVGLYYYCQSGNDAGGLNTNHEPWTVKYHRGNADMLTSVDVEIAWTA